MGSSIGECLTISEKIRCPIMTQGRSNTSAGVPWMRNSHLHESLIFFLQGKFNLLVRSITLGQIATTSRS